MQRFIRCGHCGLPHDADVVVCPSSGLRIEPQKNMVRRRRSAPELATSTQGLLSGQVIERKYRLCELIGEGGMSAIYDAEHIGLSRHVAIKVLHPSLASDPRAMSRLQHEAKVVSAIGHPNICAVYDLGTTEDGSPFLVMERLYGQTLAARIAKDGAMVFPDLAPLLRQVLTALTATHQKGIVHRDLKPENIFIERPKSGGKPSAKLLDFGISKSSFGGGEWADSQRGSQPGMVMGTPYYMAPEQARGDSGLDQRVDLWALGVILYEALTGRRPFVAPNYNALLVKILTSDPRPIDRMLEGAPAALGELVTRALRKLPEDRFQSASEFLRALEAVQRQFTADDPQAPTLVMQRAAVRAALGQVVGDAGAGAGAWRAAIDDPETNIDDHTAEPHGVAHDTDRAPPSVGPEHEAPEGGDTEIMTREDGAFDTQPPAAPVSVEPLVHGSVLRVPHPPTPPRVAVPFPAATLQEQAGESARRSSVPRPTGAPSAPPRPDVRAIEARPPARFERAAGTGMLVSPPSPPRPRSEPAPPFAAPAAAPRPAIPAPPAVPRPLVPDQEARRVEPGVPKPLPSGEPGRPNTR